MSGPYLIRPALADDEPLLFDFLYHSLYTEEGGTPLPKEVVYTPEIAIYAQGWGRDADFGFIAEHGIPVGAAWCRQWRDGSVGYGFVHEDIPELSIAVLPDYRGQGIGTKLLTVLFDLVASRFDGVSLSVDRANPAMELYRRLGFVEIDSRDESHPTMLLRFK